MNTRHPLSSSPSPVPPSRPAAPVRVLLVEDDDTLRRALRAGLERHGCVVADAADGNEAQAWLHAAAFDWVVTDIVMPECDGIELLRRLRSAHPHTGVVAMSGGGLGDAGDYLHMARLLGAHHVLKKPFVYTELLPLLVPGGADALRPRNPAVDAL